MLTLPAALGEIKHSLLLALQRHRAALNHPQQSGIRSGIGSTEEQEAELWGGIKMNKQVCLGPATAKGQGDSNATATRRNLKGAENMGRSRSLGWK